MKTSKRAYATSIKDKLVCAHCKAMFVGTQKQAEHHVYKNSNLFCSSACRGAFLSNKFKKPIPNSVCKQCNNTFFTRRNNPQFCGIDCYTKSNQFKAMARLAREKSYGAESIAKRAKMLKTGAEVECLECKQYFYIQLKLLGSKKFCSRVCYRSYMDKRFDRQIANPDKMALPQGYDGFLNRLELNCLVEGCEWTGKHLSTHMNIAHGVQAKDFKRAAGFNLNTGVVSKDLSETMSKRAKVGVAVHNPYKLENMRKMKNRSVIRSYVSNEAKEHRKKARIFIGTGPQRVCKGCNTTFTQSTPMGRAMYCCATCRDAHYSSERKKLTTPWYLRERNLDGTFKILTQVNANG
jgi:hypothetical protein